MTDQPEELRYRDVMGVLHVEMFNVGETIPLRGGNATLSARHVETEAGRRLVQKFVPRRAPANDRRHDRLDREIRAGTRLGQVFGPYLPDEVVTLFGYNTDVEEPYVLLDAFRGQPATPAIAHFGEQERHRFQAGLLRAVQHTAAAGVVHGAIRLDALFWDGQKVQLTDFEASERTGDKRSRWGVVPLRSPEQVAGHGPAHPGDDIWGVGMVLRELVLGPQHAAGARPDISGDPERVRVLLAGVFADQAEARPDAMTLLRRLRVDSPITMVLDIEESLREGRQQFELASARKRGEDPTHLVRAPYDTVPTPGAAATAPQPPPATVGSTRRPTRPLPSLPIVALAVLVVVVVVIATVWLRSA